MTGRQYTPANGTEGMEFEARWCRRCACDDQDAVMDGDSDGCRILAEACGGGKPRQWIQDVPDGPLCTAFVEDVGQGLVDPLEAEHDQRRYDALPRCPVSGRPVIT